MIEVEARDWPTFLVAFAVVGNAGVTPTPVGGNKMTLPDGTDQGLLEALAGIDGVTVWTDQPTHVPASDTGPDAPVEQQPPAGASRTKPAKRATRKPQTRGEE